MLFLGNARNFGGYHPDQNWGGYYFRGYGSQHHRGSGSRFRREDDMASKENMVYQKSVISKGISVKRNVCLLSLKPKTDVKKQKKLYLYDCSLFQRQTDRKVVLHISGISAGNSETNQHNIQRRNSYFVAIS